MSYQSGLSDKQKPNYTDPVGVHELIPSNKVYQRASFWICASAVVALIIIIALSVALANSKANPPSPAPVPASAGFLADNGCLYTSEEVVNVQTLAAEFYRCATVHNAGFSANQLFAIEGEISKLNGCYWDLSSPTTTDFQKLLNLQTKLTTVLANPTVHTTEKLRLKFIDAEVTLVKLLVEKGHFFAATAASAADFGWWSDVVIDSAMTAKLLAAVDHRQQAGYDTVVVRWLANYVTYLPRWRGLMEQAVADNKTHANIVMSYQKTFYLQAFDANFSSVCPTLNASLLEECHSLTNNITALHTSMRTYFVDTYLPACAVARPDTAPGLWHVPDGNEVYEAWLKYHLGFTETASVIHELGKQRVIENRNATLATIRKIDPSITTFEEAVAALSNSSDPRWFICNNDTSEIIQYVQSLQARIEDNLLDEFGYFSGVRPAVKVEGAPSTYANAATYDHIRNFWTGKPIYNVGRNQWCFTNETQTYYFDRLQLATVMHEAMPGHAMQLQLEVEVDCGLGAPYSSGPTAYYEGWGLYAETLGYKMGVDAAHPKGLYTNPFDELAFFTGTMLRNNRLQVDSGLHGDIGAQNWDFNKAWQETVSNGFPESYAKVECERYIQMPGQATAYMVGNLKLLQLRMSLEEELGNFFDAAEFHNIILRWGGVTFDDLAALLTTYSANKLKPGSATQMFGYDLVRDQFSPTKPVIGLGRTSQSSVESPSQGGMRLAARLGGPVSSVPSRYHRFP